VVGGESVVVMWSLYRGYVIYWGGAHIKGRESASHILDPVLGGALGLFWEEWRQQITIKEFIYFKADLIYMEYSVAETWLSASR